jgi:alkylation response protein AidB-like acyl-CoA dehydrogenase
VVAAWARRAGGAASLAIGVNITLLVVLPLARRHSMARAAGDERREAAFAGSLRAVAHDGIVLAAAMSEPGQDLTRPATRALRTDRGWRIDGHKIFCTMAPAATTLLTSVGFADGDGVERFGYAEVPADTAGVRINDDWDAMGMRASGSHSVTFDGVELPAGALRGGFRAGQALPYLERAVANDPQRGEARFALADALTRLERPADALQHWLELARLQPRRFEAWFNIALSQLALGDVQRAQQARDRAAELAPPQPGALAELDRLLENAAAASPAPPSG